VIRSQLIKVTIIFLEGPKISYLIQMSNMPVPHARGSQIIQFTHYDNILRSVLLTK
jgi:hypothetical protein